MIQDVADSNAVEIPDDRLARIFQFLELAPEDLRNVYEYHYWHRLSISEIAQTLEISSKEVSRLLIQIRSQLKEIMGTDDPE